MARLRRVFAGQPLAIPADTFNTFAEAAQDFQDRQRTVARSPIREARDSDLVLVRNDTGDDQNRFAVLAIDSIIISDEDNDDDFRNRPAFSAILPQEDVDSGFVILCEPIADGSFGRAMISGVTPVQIDVADELHTKAHLIPAESGYLESGSGPARILWKETGTGLKWAAVQFPVGSSGSMVEKFRVVQEFDDYLTARRIESFGVYGPGGAGPEGDPDGTEVLSSDEESELYEIAKPAHLRRSEYEQIGYLGLTYAYNAANRRRVDDSTYGDYTYEVITPPYMTPGDDPASQYTGSKLLAVAGSFLCHGNVGEDRDWFIAGWCDVSYGRVFAEEY